MSSSHASRARWFGHTSHIPLQRNSAVQVHNSTNFVLVLPSRGELASTAFFMKKSRSHFPRIDTIAFDGPQTENALAFRHYNPDEVIDGRTMSAHLRFSIAYWHSFRGAGSDP